MLYSLFCALDYIEGELLISYGDSVFDYFTDFSGLERLVEMSDPTEDEMKVLVR